MGNVTLYNAVMIEDTKEKPAKILCRKCKQITNHLILHNSTIAEGDEEEGVWESTSFSTAQCKGCETICLLERYWFSEDIDPQTGDPEMRTTVHPDPHQTRVKIDGIHY